jgi:hypothetical protein
LLIPALKAKMTEQYNNIDSGGKQIFVFLVVPAKNPTFGSAGFTNGFL